MLLHGKVALVTGASRGIGKAVAERFSEEGARVALCARDEKALDQVARAIDPSLERVFWVRADAGNPGEIRNAVEQTARRWDRIHVLINNAGLSGLTPAAGEGDSDWDRILDVNLTGAWRFVRETLVVGATFHLQVFPERTIHQEGVEVPVLNDQLSVVSESAQTLREIVGVVRHIPEESDLDLLGLARGPGRIGGRHELIVIADSQGA